MPLTTKCTCGKTLDIADEQHGQPAQCPWCGNRFIAGAAISSTTAVQAEEPMPKVAERAARPEGKQDETPTIALTQPWYIPPIGWSLILGFLGCGALAACAFFMIDLPHGDSMLDIAHTQVKGPLTKACETFRLKHGRFPATLAELREKNAVGGPFLESDDALIDPWGQPYKYDPKGLRNNGVKPDIWTVAPTNGVEIGNWPMGG
jgi:hypothetical protein